MKNLLVTSVLLFFAVTLFAQQRRAQGPSHTGIGANSNVTSREIQPVSVYTEHDALGNGTKQEKAVVLVMSNDYKGSIVNKNAVFSYVFLNDKGMPIGKPTLITIDGKDWELWNAGKINEIEWIAEKVGVKFK